MRRGSELVSFMNMHSMTELDAYRLCRISRNDWGKEFCLIFYLEATIGLCMHLVVMPRNIGLNGFFKINAVSNSI